MITHDSKSGTGNHATRKKLLALRTAILSDALGKTGAMDHDMRCFSANCRMAGPAMTLRIHTADILMIGKALSICPRGHVLIIDGQGELNTALWGGATTASARLRGLAGVVIDGAIRDVAAIRRDRLPVFARAVVPNAGGAEYAGEMDIPIQCGGVVVNPGNWVIGDEDGVVVIPADRLGSVVEKAVRLVEVEKMIDREIRRGKELASILHYDEVLERKSKEAFLPQMRFLQK
jgi:3-hexulose-6-phosphate synthase/6-phospho-3-hexuloisomerase